MIVHLREKNKILSEELEQSKMEVKEKQMENEETLKRKVKIHSIKMTWNNSFPYIQNPN